MKKQTMFHRLNVTFTKDNCVYLQEIIFLNTNIMVVSRPLYFLTMLINYTWGYPRLSTMWDQCASCLNLLLPFCINWSWVISLRQYYDLYYLSYKRTDSEPKAIHLFFDTFITKFFLATKFKIKFKYYLNHQH